MSPLLWGESLYLHDPPLLVLPSLACPSLTPQLRKKGLPHPKQSSKLLCPTPLKLHHYAQMPLGFPFLKHLTSLIIPFSSKLSPSLVSIQPFVTGSLSTSLSVLSQLLLLVVFLLLTIKTSVFPKVLALAFFSSLSQCLSHFYSLLWLLIALISLFLGLTCPLSCLIDIRIYMFYRPSNLICPKLCSLHTF